MLSAIHCLLLFFIKYNKAHSIFIKLLSLKIEAKNKNTSKNLHNLLMSIVSKFADIDSNIFCDMKIEEDNVSLMKIFSQLRSDLDRKNFDLCSFSVQSATNILRQNRTKYNRNFKYNLILEEIFEKMKIGDLMFTCLNLEMSINQDFLKPSLECLYVKAIEFLTFLTSVDNKFVNEFFCKYRYFPLVLQQFCSDLIPKDDHIYIFYLSLLNNLCKFEATYCDSFHTFFSNSRLIIDLISIFSLTNIGDPNVRKYLSRLLYSITKYKPAVFHPESIQMLVVVPYDSNDVERLNIFKHISLNLFNYLRHSNEEIPSFEYLYSKVVNLILEIIQKFLLENPFELPMDLLSGLFCDSDAIAFSKPILERIPVVDCLRYMIGKNINQYQEKKDAEAKRCIELSHEILFNLIDADSETYKRFLKDSNVCSHCESILKIKIDKEIKMELIDRALAYNTTILYSLIENDNFYDLVSEFLESGSSSHIMRTLNLIIKMINIGKKECKPQLTHFLNTIKCVCSYTMDELAEEECFKKLIDYIYQECNDTSASVVTDMLNFTSLLKSKF